MQIERAKKVTSSRIGVDLVGLNGLHLLVRAAEPLHHLFGRYIRVHNHGEPLISGL